MGIRSDINAVVALEKIGELSYMQQERDILRTERDRLAAENAELRKKLDAARDKDERFDCLAAENEDLRRRVDLYTRNGYANATLDKLREVISDDSMWCCIDCKNARAILYPKETSE